MGLIVDRAAVLLAGPGGGLLLDLDGTLIDSEPVHAAAYREYFTSRGWHVGDQVIREFTGRRAPDVLRNPARPLDRGGPDGSDRRRPGRLRATTVAYKPVPGAARLMAACALVGLPVAVVTSARREWVTVVLALLGAGHSSFPMVTAQDCGPGKPDPEPFRRGAHLLGLRPADLVAAEDSPAGIASARGAGIGHVIGMTTSGSPDLLLAAGAHATAPDLVALAAVVGQLNRTCQETRAL
jgi:mannitol-1-/sugar-/sorbitol-6-phosphatase